MASPAPDKPVRKKAQPTAFQSFANATMKTGDGGDARGPYAQGGNGGSIGSNNVGFAKQRFDQAVLTTGSGGSADAMGNNRRPRKRSPVRAAVGGDGGSIGSGNQLPGLQQDFFKADLDTGLGGNATSVVTKGGHGGSIGSHQG
ncbi:hypothetical protein BS47DRAFT_1350748 [Hydnum rufescens UP504]|uniref:Uncharacterized protein n=1 Tax=Hydnum rufescens UP504 TaxID=1448309 RepID=A0A9P6ALU9_9AGAM|nr:hypothetical protein BS47DRAFT_1350748 [Hydnum rufescens UP504]